MGWPIVSFHAPGSGAGQCTGFARPRPGSQSLSLMTLISEWLTPSPTSTPRPVLFVRFVEDTLVQNAFAAPGGPGAATHRPIFPGTAGPGSPITVQGGFKKERQGDAPLTALRKKLRWSEVIRATV